MKAAPMTEEERIVPGTPLWREHHEEHIQRYAFAARWMAPAGRVLDAGCGVGYGAAFLADRGASRVVAVDCSAEALAMGRRDFARPGIEWMEDDCQTLSHAAAHGPFDLIVNFENLEHLQEPEGFLRAAQGLLAPDGVLITSTPNRIGVSRLRGLRLNAPSTNPFHSQEYSTEEFRALLAPYFAQVEMHQQTLDPPERLGYEAVIIAMWSNPLMRLGRWMHRVLRGHPGAERVMDLLPPRRHRISSELLTDEFVITQLAVCRAPRVGSA